MAAVIPNLFTRIDLWAMLLPGYVTLILGLVLFSPSSLDIGNEPAFNLFSAIVFLVAGPAIGFTLTQLSNIITLTLWEKQKYDFLREYYQIRLNCKPNEIAEFDNIDARITFSRSTGLGLMIIGLLLMLSPSFSILPFPSSGLSDSLSRFIISVVIYGTGILLIIGATLETVNVRDVLICRKMLNNWHNIEWSSVREMYDKIYYSDRRKTHKETTIRNLVIAAIIIMAVAAVAEVLVLMLTL
jgi:hypothetical protein